MRWTAVLGALTVALAASCGTDVRVASVESADTQRYETCKAISDGFTYVNQSSFGEAHKRFAYAARSARAFQKTQPREPDADTLAQAAEKFEAIPESELGATASADVMAAANAVTAVCNGITKP